MRITDTHVFFWHGEFSNWHSCKFRYKKLTFFNTEQAFMWEKAMFFNDIKSAEEILRNPNPKINKALGRQVKNFDTNKWSSVSYQIMIDVNYAKYSQHPYLRRLLLDTENKILVEASPYDQIWGIGLNEDNDDCLYENKWKGLNLLGKALMEVRNKLKEKWDTEII